MSADERRDSIPQRPGASWLLPLLWLSLTGLMLGLSVWQFYRGLEKGAMLDAIEQAAHTPAMDLPVQPELISTAAERYARVRISGRYLVGTEVLWDNQILSGQAGYDVLTPFRLDDGRALLVNRGWVPGDARRDVLPEVGVPESLQNVTLERTGHLARPSMGLLQQEALLDAPGQWPQRAQFLDYESLGAVLGYALVPAVLQLQARGESTSPAWPELYQARWQPAQRMGPATHFGYSAQWLAMSVALSALFLYHRHSRARADAS